MLEQLIPAFRATIVLAFLVGIIFPFVITGLAQITLPKLANGSLVKTGNGQLIGSKLIAQSFTKPQYFHPRPSAAGTGYAGEASGGTNLGPTSAKLIYGDKTFSGIKQLVEQYRVENRLDNVPVPVDAVTRSGSGLDPHISLENAALQIQRIAAARNISEKQVSDLVQKHTEAADLGFLGESRVNVLELNLALDKTCDHG
jgi:K+-transporting ATPase ATPase C chain